MLLRMKLPRASRPVFPRNDSRASLLDSLNTGSGQIQTRVILSEAKNPPWFSTEDREILCFAQNDNKEKLYDDLPVFLPTTSSRLVPRSLSIAIAALRPGWPVTEPPGAVHPPV